MTERLSSQPSSIAVEDLPAVSQKVEIRKKKIDPEIIEKLPEEDLVLLRKELGLHPLLDVNSPESEEELLVASKVTPAAERQQSVPTPWEGDGSAERYTEEEKPTFKKRNTIWSAIKQLFG